MKKISLDIQKFANPAAKSMYIHPYTLAVNFDEVLDEENNSSLFSISGTFTTKTNFVQTGEIRVHYTIKDENGTTILATTKVNLIANILVKTYNIPKVSINIPHNNNGTKNIIVEFSMLAVEQTFLPKPTGDFSFTQNIALNEINRRSVLNSVANFTMDDSYTAISYTQIPNSGAIDSLILKVPGVAPREIDYAIWNNAQEQIDLTAPVTSLDGSSIKAFLSTHINAEENPQIAFSLNSTLNGTTDITTVFAYVSQAYIFSKYKLTEDTEYQTGKIYYHREPEYYFTGDSVYLDGVQYFKLESGQFLELTPGTDYQIGASIPANTIYERRWVYNKLFEKVYDPETQSYVGDYFIGDPIKAETDQIYERDDKYNICKHVLHNKEEGKYRVAINGLADPTGPPLQVFNGYLSDDKEDLFFYRPGDKVTVTGYVTGGLITGSSSTIKWTIIFPKRLDYVEAPILKTENTTVDKFKIFCRDVNSKYIWACGGTGNKYRGGIRGTKTSSAAWTIEFLKYPSSGPCNKIKMSVTRDENHPWKEYDSSKDSTQTTNKGEGAGSTVPNNTPIAVEVSSLILEFPR